MGIAIASVLQPGATMADDWTFALIVDRAAARGCRLLAHADILGETELRLQLVRWISNPAIDVVFVTGADAEVARRASHPLVTEPQSDPHAVRCGSTLVVSLPPSLASASIELDRILAGLTPAKRNILTTGSIAVIGDIPVPAESPIDLRGAGRRGLWAVGIVALAASACIAAVAVNVVQRNLAIAAAEPHPEPDPAPALVASTPAVTPAVTPPVVRARVSPPPPTKIVVKPRTKPAAPARIAAKPQPAAAPVAAPAAEPVMADEMCDEVSCAAHDYERECCTPFRPVQGLIPNKLDKQMVASTLAPVKEGAHTCAVSASISDGSVKVAVTVRGDGHVANVIVQDAPEVGVGACIADAVRGTTFPITVGGGSFVFRFDL